MYTNDFTFFETIMQERWPKCTSNMKFRAVMNDVQYIREFHNIVLTLSKLTKECVMIIQQDKIYFIANEETGSTAPLVWVQIDVCAYFSDYKMEGYNEEHQKIVLAVSTINLGRAFSVLRNNVRICKMKLKNIQFPCLSFEATVTSQSCEQTRQTVHDVPVSVIPRSDWPYYDLPQRPQSNIILHILSNRLLRGFIEKIKNLSPTVMFYASGGELSVVAETDTATITTRFKNLKILSSTNSNKPEASCSVDCKKTALFFAALQVPILELSLGIVSGRLIHIEVDIRQGMILNTILPTVCTE